VREGLYALYAIILYPYLEEEARHIVHRIALGSRVKIVDIGDLGLK